MHNQDAIDKKIDELANISGEIFEIIHKNKLPPKIMIVLLVRMLRTMVGGVQPEFYRKALSAMMQLKPEEFQEFFARQIIAAYFNKEERN